MHLDSLYIQQIRNISALELTFSSGINHIIGANGHGKSSILEAIHFLIMGSSFRTHNIKEAVQSKMESLFAEGALTIDGGVQRKISLAYDGIRRVVSVNNEILPSSSLLFGVLIGVTSTSADCELIFGSPAERRYFIDEQIAQIDPQYVYYMKRLQRALQQRNAQLKQKQIDGIEAWEEQIANATGYISVQRYITLQKLMPYFISYSTTMIQKLNQGAIEVRYLPSMHHLSSILSEKESSVAQKELQIGDAMKRQFSEKREIEIRAGATLYGPQRDDIAFLWNEGASIKSQASLGQAKSISLALRLAEWSLLKERSVHGNPLFLMDDFHSFLDQQTMDSFLSIAQETLGQVIITSHQSLSAGWLSKIREIHIIHGRAENY